MKKNILNVMLALCIVSFSTVAMAQSKPVKSKPKTSAAKPKAKVRKVTPPPPPPDQPMESMYEREVKMVEPPPPPPAMEERGYDAPPPQADNSPNEIGRREEPMTAPVAAQLSPMEYEKPREDEVFYVAEQQAEFPEGQAELFKWLNANIKYPAVARENSIEGKVIIRMIIERDGSISNASILRGANDLLDKEAIRVVNSMPKWKPGKQRGSDVRSYFTLPVVFKLDNIPADKK